MPRPEKCRWIGNEIEFDFFKPIGVPLRELEQVDLAHDELEAVRLADFENLKQEEAAERMNISRPTFSRIIARAHSKIADALVNGKAIRISGGTVKFHPGMGPCRGGRGRKRWRHGQS